MKAVAMETAEDSLSQASDEQLVSLQIYVPELVVQKCMQFNREELIWDVKNQILAALPKELKEGFNYGLFCPPVNGRAGKFLDEERPLADYPFADNSAYVELRYKRRIYKISMEEKQLKQLHSRANLRRLLDHIHNNHVEKVTKMCSRGLDPNFHCQETGESPLTLATSLKHPAKVIMALVNGGAHLDFRTKDGATVLHKAVEKNNLEALRTLLDLGSSPNYKDTRGLTTLYYSIIHHSNPQLTEMLLHDHAMIGTSDPHGWQEVHQACKYGMVQHLEHLLYYGADMNARNASGNTPLHVCAVNDQESCARVLLFRGSDKGALNYANQNPHQVAVIAGNLRLADIIKNHKTEDVVPYREAPRYNPRRRTSTANMGSLSQNHSDTRLELVLSGRPSSPCPSNNSLPHLSSSSEGGSQPNATGEEGDGSSGPVTNHSSDGTETTPAGANNSGTDSDPFDSAKSTPLMESVCVCVEEYNPSTSGHLQLVKGDLVEVLGVSGSGYLEGRRRDGEEGLFPAICIQEMTIRCADTLPAGCRHKADGKRMLNSRGGDMPKKWRTFGEPRTVILHKGKKGFGFILRGAKATSPLMERQPTEFWPSLQYLDDVDKGGVAEMAGLKKGDFLLEINGQDVSQASHERVVTIIRQSGDLVSMTVVTVVQQTASILAPSEKTQLINRQCATLPRKLSTKKAPLPPKRDPKTTLSVGRARARSMVAGLAEIEVLDHTLNEYDSEGRSTKSSSIESIPNKPSSSATPDSTTASTTATTTPTSTNQTPASTRLRQSSQHVSATELEDFFARHLPSSTIHHRHGPVKNRYATMARIHKSKAKRSRQHRTKEDMDYRMPKNYSSTPELIYPEGPEFNTFLLPRKSRSMSDVHSRHSGRSGHAKVKDKSKKDKTLQRQHSSSADQKPVNSSEKADERAPSPESGPSVIKQNGSDIYAETVPVVVKAGEKNSGGRASCPPPSYPPPPPPVGQVVKVDVSGGEYANLTSGRQPKSTAIMSSFRPTDSAKLYASPDAFVTVGYKKDHAQKGDATLPRHMGKGGSRSQSLPPKMPAGSGTGSTPGGRSTGSLDNDNSSGESAIGYTHFKGSQRSKNHSESGHQTSDRRGTLKKVKQSKFPSAVSESASPKHYPNLTQHDSFIQEPDFDTSEEEEDTTSGMDSKSSLVTFKALETNADAQKTEATEGKKSDATATMTIHRKKTKSATDASRHANGENEQNRTKSEEKTKRKESRENKESNSSALVQSEETGERIFIKPGESEAGEKIQNKKVGPTPPPKKTDDKLKDLAEVAKTELLSEKELNARAIREAFEKQLPNKETGDKSETDPVSKSSKEHVAFKATIVLKQTEIVGKEAKETLPRSKNRELVHQQSAHELKHASDSKSKEDSRKDPNIKSPPQTVRERPASVDICEMTAQKAAQNDLSQKNKNENSQKIAPAVPRKPKVEENKNVDENAQESCKNVHVDKLSAEQNPNSANIDAQSRSVKENIYNFEKRSEIPTAAKSNFSPRRKSDVIRITLIGSQKGNEQEKQGTIGQTMKTSKSCPKTFEEDDLDENTITSAMLHSDAHSQVTRFSAETPTTSIASTNFNDDWRRSDDVSPVNVSQHVDLVIKKPPDTPPKNTTTRRFDNFNKTQTLGRKSSEREMDLHDIDITHFNETMTLNRQSMAKSELRYQQEMLHHQLAASRASSTTTNPTSTAHPSHHAGRQTMISVGVYTPTSAEAMHIPGNLPLDLNQKLSAAEINHIRNREILEESIQVHQKAALGPMSAQARLLDHRHVRAAAPAAPRVSPPKNREDVECLKLCQRVDKSLQLIRLQVDSLRMAAASEPESLTELVPPPPEFNYAQQGGGHHQAPPMHIAPPPEFSDESLARQRRAQNMMPTMDAPVSRRVVPPDSVTNYPYPEHVYRGYGGVQSPQEHPHHPAYHQHHHGIPNNHSSSPTKTMTMTRSGYSQHHQHGRHESNCNTLPHPGSRMMMMHPQGQPHSFSTGRSEREAPRMMSPIPPIPQHKEFRQKPLHQWNMKDVADWLESLFLPEYKITFAEAGITGSKLANMDNNDLMGLGVKQAGHRLNMERSIKWYLK